MRRAKQHANIARNPHAGLFRRIGDGTRTESDIAQVVACVLAAGLPTSRCRHCRRLVAHHPETGVGRCIACGRSVFPERE